MKLCLMQQQAIHHNYCIRQCYQLIVFKGKAITVLSVIITTGVISTATIIGEKATSAITIISVLKCNLHAILQL